MAENRAVWGIDIGQAGLKAIRLKYAESAKQVLAVAFDFIPHPKILSQPDAIPKDLIKQALATFLSRNDVKGDQIAISLPGSTALARFIQLPPVESSKVADVVKYEARQQIPFALEDVVWDFQTLGGGIEESGFMLGAEVGLFAMKKEQVAEQMFPFNEAKVEIELVQIAPLALHNFLCYDHLGMRLGEETATDNFMVVLDMGTDNTTLLVTNAEKIWIRNVPIGGNHFTRALLKEMKLTFAKAEHLKCNATKAPDPRAVFQALRPVFNDYVSEIQRSIGYFSSVNRDATITKVIGVGNGFKLAGLQKFLQQNLQYEVERVEAFKAVIGDTVLNAPVFQENIMSFVVPYGLALQTLNLTKIHTTLLPIEIRQARKIRRKKPWAIATAATLLAGLAASTAGYANANRTVSKDRFGKEEKAVADLKGQVSAGLSKYDSTKAEHAKLVADGESLVTYVDTRELWPELYRSINECLPRPTKLQLDLKDIREIPQLHIRGMGTKRYVDLKTWFDAIPAAAKGALSEAEKTAGVTGPGYVVTLTGEHFYHPQNDKLAGGPQFIRDTLITNLRKSFHKAEGTVGKDVPVGHLGISLPVISNSSNSQVMWYQNGPPKTGRPGLGNVAPMPVGVIDAGGVGIPGQKKDGDPGTSNLPISIEQRVFEVQFVWKPTIAKQRIDAPVTAPVGAEAVDVGGALPEAPVQNGVAPGSVAPPMVQPGVVGPPGGAQPGAAHGPGSLPASK